jgi:hypothetical protein
MEEPMKAFPIVAALLLSLAFSQSAFARVERRDSDLKLPTQQMVEKQTITDADLGAAGAVLDDHAGPASAAAVTVSTGFTQPDVPRVLSITPAGTTTDVEACTVTVTGKNIQNQTITDTFAFLANASTATTGTKAFKSITSAAWPANCESGGFAATWDIDTTDKLGLSKCMDQAGHVVMAVFNGAYETTRPTCSADADEVEKNFCDINGTLDGSKDAELFFFQNFRCKP